ncbi:MAG: glycosyl hydrolase [Bacteroidales bacterium]
MKKLFYFILIGSLPYAGLSQTLVNPNATEAARKLKTLLDSLYGKKIISGQMDDSYLLYIRLTTGGKEPALMGYDFNGICPTQSGNYDADKAIKWVKQRGGIAQFNWHWISPDGNGDFYTKNFNLANALADTSSFSYKNILRDIDLVAAECKRMQDSGIAIIWRPLHEAEGKWFWWGMSGGEACKKLYRLMYDRMVNYHGINNLIWAWTSYGTTRENWYPGDDVVDLIVYDYPDYSANGSWHQFQQLFGQKGKLFGIGEDGRLIDPEILSTQPWLYFMTWAYMVKDPSQKDGKNPKDWLMQVYNDPRVLTLEDLNPGPKAKAGYSETVYDNDNDGGEYITLDGSLSTADNDSIVSYSWTENEIEIATGIKTEKWLPIGTHKIKLTIQTKNGITKTSWVIKRIRLENIALNKSFKVSSTESGYGNVGQYAIDGNLSTRWSSAYSDPQWYMIDLGKRYNITNIIITWENASAKDYQIQQSNDGTNWVTVKSFTLMKAGARTDSILNLTGGARYIRIYGTKRTTSWGYSIFEIEVNGSENPAAEPVTETTKLDNIEVESFMIYPTVVPRYSKVKILMPAHSSAKSRIEIYNLQGKRVKVARPAMGNELFLNATFPAGVYVVKLVSPDKTYVNKLYII